jgi:hypothetical protein
MLESLYHQKIMIWIELLAKTKNKKLSYLINLTCAIKNLLCKKSKNIIKVLIEKSF